MKKSTKGAKVIKELLQLLRRAIKLNNRAEALKIVRQIRRSYSLLDNDSIVRVEANMRRLCLNLRNPIRLRSPRERQTEIGDVEMIGQSIPVSGYVKASMPKKKRATKRATVKTKKRAKKKIARKVAKKKTHIRLISTLPSFDMMPVESAPESGGDAKQIGDLGVQESGDELYPVWYGTDRAPYKNRVGYKGERGNETSFGRVDVMIPKNHLFGDTGSSFVKKMRRWKQWGDNLSVERILKFSEDGFYNNIQEYLKNAEDETHALIYIHGYRTTFKNAAIRAAQMGKDLNVQGVTAFYSWPSGGKLSSYNADGETIQSSESRIERFISDFAQKSSVNKVHIIAHSMGNRGLLRALQRISANILNKSGVEFGQIFLAAPDVDRDLFLELSKLYAQFSQRTTLYASNADKAVWLSSKINKNPRAGYYQPYTVADGIDTLLVPDFNVDLLGHSFFAEAEALLNDMHSLLRMDQAPSKRIGLKSVPNQIGQMWEFVKRK